MQIRTYTISKQALTAMPAKERDFFLLAGHFANEIIFLSKLLVITRIRTSENILAKTELIQSLFIQKILAEKLCEGWVMIKRYYHKSSISKDYNEFLEEKSQEAIKNLRRYFGYKSNVLIKVRNSYSFHYDPNKLEPAIQEMEDGDEFDMYIAENYINSLYYVSESIINKTMLNELELNDMRTAFNNLHKDIARVLELFMTFIPNFMKVAMSRHFVSSESNPVLEEIETDLPSLKNLRLPFFVNASSSY